MFTVLPLIQNLFNDLDLQKVVVPLLVRHLWVEMILKSLVVPDVVIQVLASSVSYQIG